MSKLAKALEEKSIPAAALTQMVGYHPVFRKISGSVGAAVLLSQIWYWNMNGKNGESRIPEDRDGWFFKSMDEIAHETGMSRSEIETARKKLVSLSLLEEERRGVPAKLWFRLNVDKIIDEINACFGPKSQFATIRRTSSPQSRDQDGRFTADKDAESWRTISENTSENTSDTLLSSPISDEISDDVGDAQNVPDGERNSSGGVTPAPDGGDSRGANDPSPQGPAAPPSPKDPPIDMQIVAAFCEETGLAKLANFGIARKQAKQLAKADFTPEEVRYLVRWLQMQPWITGGISLGLCLQQADRFRTSPEGKAYLRMVDPDPWDDAPEYIPEPPRRFEEPFVPKPAVDIDYLKACREYENAQERARQEIERDSPYAANDEDIDILLDSWGVVKPEQYRG